MRITGISENDDGAAYIIEPEGGTAGRHLVLYDERSGGARFLKSGETDALFEKGVMEKCSFPASEIFFPDELEELERFVASFRPGEAGGEEI